MSYPSPSSSSLPAINNPGMKLTGWRELTLADRPPARLVVCSEALPKTGKTHFALTAPGPIALLSADSGTLEIATKFATQFGKRIMFNQFKVPPSGLGVDNYAREWDKIYKMIMAIKDNKDIRTLVLDTHTEIHELFKLSRFGKLTQVMPHHYGPVNRDAKDIIEGLMQARQDLNIVLINKVKKEYKDNKKGESSWTGKFERAGFEDLKYIADVVIKHYYSSEGGLVVRDVDFEKHDFGLEVLNCRNNHEVSGSVFLSSSEMCSFKSLAMAVFPDIDACMWD